MVHNRHVSGHLESARIVVVDREVIMYCTECGQLVSRNRFGYLIHDYQDKDWHTPVVEGTDGYDCD